MESVDAINVEPLFVECYYPDVKFSVLSKNKVHQSIESSSNANKSVGSSTNVAIQSMYCFKSHTSCKLPVDQGLCTRSVENCISYSFARQEWEWFSLQELQTS